MDGVATSDEHEIVNREEIQQRTIDRIFNDRLTEPAAAGENSCSTRANIRRERIADSVCDIQGFKSGSVISRE